MTTLCQVLSGHGINSFRFDCPRDVRPCRVLINEYRGLQESRMVAAKLSVIAVVWLRRGVLIVFGRYNDVLRKQLRKLEDLFRMHYDTLGVAHGRKVRFEQYNLHERGPGKVLSLGLLATAFALAYTFIVIPLLYAVSIASSLGFLGVSGFCWRCSSHLLCPA